MESVEGWRSSVSCSAWCRVRTANSTLMPACRTCCQHRDWRRSNSLACTGRQARSNDFSQEHRLARLRRPSQHPCATHMNVGMAQDAECKALDAACVQFMGCRRLRHGTRTSAGVQDVGKLWTTGEQSQCKAHGTFACHQVGWAHVTSVPGVPLCSGSLRRPRQSFMTSIRISAVLYSTCESRQDEILYFVLQSLPLYACSRTLWYTQPTRDFVLGVRLCAPLVSRPASSHRSKPCQRPAAHERPEAPAASV